MIMILRLEDWTWEMDEESSWIWRLPLRRAFTLCESMMIDNHNDDDCDSSPLRFYTLWFRIILMIVILSWSSSVIWKSFAKCHRFPERISTEIMLTTIIIMIVMLIIIMMLMILFMRAMSTSRSGKESTVEFFLDELAELELARVAPELKIIDIAGENGATVMMVVKNGDTIRDPEGHFIFT